MQAVAQMLMSAVPSLAGVIQHRGEWISARSPGLVSQ